MALSKFIVGALATLTLSGAAQAVLIQFGDPNSEIFFGEDLQPNPVQTVNPVKDPAIARGKFLSKLDNTAGSYGFEGLSSWDLGLSPLAVDFNDGFNGTGGTLVTATISGIGTVGGTSGPGRFNTTPGGSRFLDVQAGTTSTNSFKIDFDKAIAAFGFYGTDVGDFEGSLKVFLTPIGSTTEEAGILVRSGSNPANNGALLFWGFASFNVAYGSIRFESTLAPGANPDYFGFDDFVVATRDQLKVSVNPGLPEPGSLALVGLGLLGAACARRRL